MINGKTASAHGIDYRWTRYDNGSLSINTIGVLSLDEKIKLHKFIKQLIKEEFIDNGDMVEWS